MSVNASTLWVDKYRPKTLDNLDHHPGISSRLSVLASSAEIPHMLFYGPSGAGKKTRIMALLRAIFGNGVEKLRLEQRSFKTPSKRTVEITTLASNYHIEMNPSDVGTSDRFVVQEVIKEIAQFRPLDGGTQRSFKVVVLTDVDHLSKGAQHALRRTMEKYVGSCRIILCCESLSKVIDPVRSRCLAMRIAAPSLDEMCGVMTTVCKKEGLQLPAGLAIRVARASGRNLRKALLTIEACRVQQYPFTDEQAVQLPDWERFIGVLAKEITRDQSPQRLIAARAKLYELLANCIPADIILKTLRRELIKSVGDRALKHDITHWAAFYEHRLQLGQKQIFHLEAFVAKFMALYKRMLLEMLNDS